MIIDKSNYGIRSPEWEGEVSRIFEDLTSRLPGVDFNQFRSWLYLHGYPKEVMENVVERSDEPELREFVNCRVIEFLESEVNATVSDSS